MRSGDPLKFVDTKKYRDRTTDAIKKTRLYDAIRWGTGAIKELPVVLAVDGLLVHRREHGIGGRGEDRHVRSTAHGNRRPR